MDIMTGMPIAVPEPLSSLIARLASLAGLAVVVSCGWFGTMELLLNHAGYEWRALVAAAIVVEGVLTIAVLEELVTLPRIRWPLAGGAALTGLLGAWIIVQELALPGLPAKPHFEGYLLTIAAALITYAVLTLAAMLTGRSRQSRCQTPWQIHHGV